MMGEFSFWVNNPFSGELKKIEDSSAICTETLIKNITFCAVWSEGTEKVISVF